MSLTHYATTPPMSETKPQAITYVPKDIWDQHSCPPSSYGKSVDYFILGSCRLNYHDDVKKHYHLTKWSPFELMIITIHGLAYRQLHTFAFLLPKFETIYSIYLGLKHHLINRKHNIHFRNDRACARPYRVR